MTRAASLLSLISVVVVVVIVGGGVGGCLAGELAVPAAPPVADAGFDQIRHLRQASEIEVRLDGRASCDPAGEGLSAETWSIVSSPSAAPALEGGEGLRAAFAAGDAGEYLVTLVVDAGERKSEPDYISVRVVDGEGDDVTWEPPSTDVCGAPIDGA